MRIKADTMLLEIPHSACLTQLFIEVQAGGWWRGLNAAGGLGGGD